ncbi:hypothetical protein [Streptomyces atratus]|uniref:hypothetical protein n=1 Tax=Streptomyces atratus TaxID=1893 RepID=UPI0022B80531|nr:hypothetical protein [Streptomyces atratus]
MPLRAFRWRMPRDGSTRYLTIGGAAALAMGAAALFASVRRRAAVGGRHRH